MTAQQEKQRVAVSDVVFHFFCIGVSELRQATPVFSLGESTQPRRISPNDFDRRGGNAACNRRGGFDGVHQSFSAAGDPLQFIRLGDQQALSRLQIQSDVNNDLRVV